MTHYRISRRLDTDQGKLLACVRGVEQSGSSLGSIRRISMSTKLKGDRRVFISYGSEIHLVEADKRQRKPRSVEYRDAWDLILHWAAREETHVRKPVKVGEAVSGVTPSQALRAVRPEEKV